MLTNPTENGLFREHKVEIQMRDQHISNGKSPLITDMRLSRLSHPRATLVAMILLAVVFLLFGVFAQAMYPAPEMPAPNTVDGAFMLLRMWAFGA